MEKTLSSVAPNNNEDDWVQSKVSRIRNLKDQVGLWLPTSQLVTMTDFNLVWNFNLYDSGSQELVKGDTTKKYIKQNYNYYLFQDILSGRRK